MPYKLVKKRGTDKYWVINKLTKKKFSKEPLPEAQAKAQLRALYFHTRGGDEPMDVDVSTLDTDDVPMPESEPVQNTFIPESSSSFDGKITEPENVITPQDALEAKVETGGVHPRPLRGTKHSTIRELIKKRAREIALQQTYLRM
jgi:hypothetical protein